MENKSNNTLLLIATAIIAILIGICYYQDNTLTKMRDLLEKTDTTTTMTIDTLYLEKTVVDTVPEYINQVIFKTDTLYKMNGDSLEATPILITLKKKEATKTIVDSTDTVQYKAFISGYDKNDEGYPRLDSIKFHISHEYYQANTETIINKTTPKKQRKWYISPQVGIGYGIIQKKPDVYIGFGIGYNF